MQFPVAFRASQERNRGVRRIGCIVGAGYPTWLVLLVSLLPATPSAQVPGRAPVAKTSKTQVVMLGTGTPGFDIARSGPATAIVVNGTAYLVDFGAGVMRRAQGAYEKGVAALNPNEIHVALQAERFQHTSSVQLAEIARRARPGLLILYHRTAIDRPDANPEDALLEEIRAIYKGKVVTGHDLDIY